MRRRVRLAFGVPGPRPVPVGRMGKALTFRSTDDRDVAMARRARVDRAGVPGMRNMTNVTDNKRKK